MRLKSLMLVLSALSALILTIMIVNGANNISEAAGHYRISLSLPDDINVTANATKETGQSFYGDEYASYSLNIRASPDAAHIAAISIMENGEGDLIYLARSLLETMNRLGYTDIAPEYREIDGNPGILMVGNQTSELPQIHGFVYLLDNQTPVVASSTFPWDNGTAMMLETLHVERAELHSPVE
jgi:hypothetical protein